MAVPRRPGAYTRRGRHEPTGPISLLQCRNRPDYWPGSPASCSRFNGATPVKAWNSDSRSSPTTPRTTCFDGATPMKAWKAIPDVSFLPGCFGLQWGPVSFRRHDGNGHIHCRTIKCECNACVYVHPPFAGSSSSSSSSVTYKNHS